MQTRGEATLVRRLQDELRSLGGPARVLNLGAGQSVIIENLLLAGGSEVVVDRVDVEDPVVDHPLTGEAWVAPAEAMHAVPSDTYDAVFANYVFEHVPDPDAAIASIARVIRSGALCLLSVPNPSAPQFRIAERTTTGFHSLVRGKRSWKVEYAFKTPEELSQRLSRGGFEVEAVDQFGQTAQYMERFALLRGMSRRYDALVDRRGWTRLMGDACIAARRS